jgi:hypothetical protein
VVLIEACEESGSYDLPAYIDHLAPRIGTPSLVVCLDSGCANYDQLWMTTSLRGLVGGTLSVKVLEKGVHSGDASGIVASSFRMPGSSSRASRTSPRAACKLDALHTEIPRRARGAGRGRREALGEAAWGKFPSCRGVPMGDRSGPSACSTAPGARRSR